MSKKRLFQVLDEMNVNDDKNKTATLPCCFDMVSANAVKAGGHVTMGVPTEVVTKIFLAEYKPMLVLLDMKEYNRLKDLPVEEAEQRSARYEKALKWLRAYAINSQNNGTIPSALVIYSTINQALTPKQTTNE